MLKINKIRLVLMVLVMFSACGGASSSEVTTLDEALTGPYAGEVSSEGQFIGNWNVSISSNGRITGAFDGAIVSGQVDSQGGFTISFNYDGSLVTAVGRLELIQGSTDVDLIGTWTDSFGNSGNFVGEKL